MYFWFEISTVGGISLSRIDFENGLPKRKHGVLANVGETREEQEEQLRGSKCLKKTRPEFSSLNSNKSKSSRAARWPQT